MAFVSFVSSGPGDPELLTLKAVKRIKAADVILFDDLSSGETLDFANPEADLISVGKRAGKPSPRQDHVSQLLVDYAKSDTNVVRLKSGDCGLFGRLEEEIIALRAEGIDYEIIPGVTSATAATAAAKIPFSRRHKTRRVQFLTGHSVTGELPDNMNLAAISSPDATSAIYMGKRTFPKLAQDLIDHGMDGKTPALLAENVSKKDEKLTYSTLEAMADTIKAQSQDGPALIIIGQLMDQIASD